MGADGIHPLFVVGCADEIVIPLYHIFKKSLDSGTFPSHWKVAKVVPIFKSDKDSLINNYRPISILFIFAKVMESIITPIMQNYFRSSARVCSDTTN